MVAKMADQETDNIPILGTSQADYLQGLGALRKRIQELEIENDRIKRDFYSTEDNDEDVYHKYLKDCNDKMMLGKDILRKNNVDFTPVDSEVQIVSILNKLRDCVMVHDEIDEPPEGGVSFLLTEIEDVTNETNEDLINELIGFLSQFWESVKANLESYASILTKFRTAVLKRLESSCTSYHNNLDVQIDLSLKYTDDITQYQNDIDKQFSQAIEIIKSFPNGIKTNLFTKSNFIDRVLAYCDKKAFPILQIIPDLSVKFENICAIARRWIDRDETYVYDIIKHIRDTRSRTRRREQDLRNHIVQQRSTMKSVQQAYIVCSTNKRKLQKLETELKDLAEQETDYTTEKKAKHEEKQQKESMVDFLKITISQSKKNYSLQSKRSRLLKQVKDLERSLSEIEQILSRIEQHMDEKSHQKIVVQEKVEVSEKTYNELKNDLDIFTKNLENLQVDVQELSDSLTQLEIIQNFKTSPEKVEDFYDRPATVKLAPSLMEKILMRKKRLSLQNNPVSISNEVPKKKTISPIKNTAVLDNFNHKTETFSKKRSNPTKNNAESPNDGVLNKKPTLPRTNKGNFSDSESSKLTTNKVTKWTNNMTTKSLDSSETNNATVGSHDTIKHTQSLDNLKNSILLKSNLKHASSTESLSHIPVKTSIPVWKSSNLGTNIPGRASNTGTSVPTRTSNPGTINPMKPSVSVNQPTKRTSIPVMRPRNINPNLNLEQQTTFPKKTINNNITMKKNNNLIRSSIPVRKPAGYKNELKYGSASTQF
ncbi:unnamed protein product [Owenia fusiformis]|uniref:Uncharacterized protein n=1 Tax=Owenia fusiformis TaxID=6347 RepID=A0A8J1TID9_OWEFU|nr:unnamed protein product [Owenia fusiformis]